MKRPAPSGVSLFEPGNTPPGDPPGPTPGDGLNEAQRRAVDHNTGPLIVLAGPGTGKTRVIVHRIARLIRDGAAPESILAVTFTVKAADQLRDRLQELIGTGAVADRVHAHTFHGLAMRLVRRFGDMLGLPPEPTIIDDAQRKRIARAVALEHGVFDGAMAEGMESLIAEGLEHIDAFQHAGKFPADCAAFAADRAARLERNADGLDAAALAAARAQHERFTRHVRLYTGFSEACRRAGQLTFEDLILLSIRLLREHADAAAICRSDYRHVVVDEFQDVNAGQIELLRLLCPPAPPDRAGPGPDLCVVGDDDQSIYLFRGADDRAFDKFEKIWPAHTVVPLTENYRSEPAILDAASVVIRGAIHRFRPGKVVEPPKDRRGRPPVMGAGVECVEAEDERQFGELVAAMIKTDLAANPGRAYASYAVIGRNHSDLDKVASALAIEDIPFRRSQGESALDEAGVTDVLRWVESLADPAAVWAVQWVLTRPPIGLPAATLQEWIRLHRAEGSRHRAGEDGRRDPGPFVGWLASHQSKDPGVRRFLELYGAMHDAAARHPAERALLEIIGISGVAYADLLTSRERARRIGFLADLVRFARDRRRVLEAPGGLLAFWGYYKDLEGSHEPFRGDEEERLESSGPDPADGRDAVTLLTGHKAKGLEFDTVFVVRVFPPHGFPKTSGGNDLVLPPGFEDRAGDARSDEDRRRDEERRLFYVACTRAERRLVIMFEAQKSRSSSMHFGHELVHDHTGLVTRLKSADVFARAEERSVRLAGAALPGTPTAVAGRLETLDRMRRESRLDAARALDAMERPGVGRADLDAAAERLRDAAARLAIAAHLTRDAKPPGWVAGLPQAEEAARIVLDRLAGVAAGGGPLFQPLQPPLELSYTAVYQYGECPRCFYLRQVNRFPEDRDAAVSLGDIAHRALRTFFDRLRLAEGEGRPAPGLDALLAIGRSTYFSSLPADSPADPAFLAQLAEQLGNLLDRLHSPADEIELVEEPMTFAYEHRGVEHRFKAKFDRLDRLPGEAGGHRIVDYKTGKESEKLTAPKPDDLQLGIYALALRHYQGVAANDRSTPAVGVAEYWHLPTGKRGRLNLADVNYNKIRKEIGDAIDGMLAGRFERNRKCEGICTYFEPRA